ncbi:MULTISPECIES: hypothetical protein [unclassified Crossiella]|uniref:hypothetical protein n=1 Tax=unclassified Crossiella TaxID=2620835 RepID=UPI001FFF834E|nr:MULTISPECIES: hypothetical protein [unclassified Crossiella]MCK2245238.1 hypothetical protein [Crossiella sp. S99.2]MCK2258891.1 hypothetical protein [Crossiella sp. S99.1]
MDPELPSEFLPAPESYSRLDDGRFRVKITEFGYVDVSTDLTGAKITDSSIEDGDTYRRHWKYYGHSRQLALLQALAAAEEWDGQPGTEPDGWVTASDGRRRLDGTSGSECYAP